MSETQTNHAAGDGSNHRLAIGVLSVTATVLLVGVLVVGMVNRTAMAIGQNDRGGDYIMLTMQFDRNTEHVAITDAAAEKVIVYGMNVNNYRLDYWTDFNLKDLKRLKPRAPGERPPMKPAKRY